MVNHWKTIVFWLTPLFTFHVSIEVPIGIAEERREPPGATPTGENRVIIIRSQHIAAYNEAIKGFEEGCKGNNISIKAIYDLKGDAAECKRVIQNIKDDDRKPMLIFAVGVLAATLAKEHRGHL